jgi:bifunctional UDP-N-acetylglucosamine pyrophosphorylase/glucosamine-1-phosphate N-acetyltransferase
MGRPDLARARSFLFLRRTTVQLTSVILAAGLGTRMKSDLPKVLHPLGGRPMVSYPVAAAEELLGGARTPVLVVGHGQEQVRAALGVRIPEGGERVRYVLQDPPLGTGHALMQAESVARADGAEALLVTYGDMPLVEADTLRGLIEFYQERGGPLAMLTVHAQDPRGFGRILRGPDGGVRAIVEEAHATPEQLAIRELNTGLYLIDARWAWINLRRLPVSRKGEYYLTDLISLAVKDGARVQALVDDDAEQFIGVNTRAHLAEAEAALRRRINRRHMEAGVTMLDPAATYVEPGVTIGVDSVILPGTFLRGTTQIGPGCVVGPHTLVQDSVVGAHCRISYAVLEQAQVDDEVEIGPFAHLRQGARLGRGVHMGNFGEVKNSTLGPGAKLGHFSYLGDATIGAEVNIGAGTITCNYDGERKHSTVVGDGAFIGSDTLLVAPVTIGAGAKTGAGSVVTHDVPDGTVAYGVPARVRG